MLPKTPLSLAVALAAGLAFAQDPLADTDLSPPVEPLPVAEALLAPIPVTLGTDDFEFAFELIRFDLQQAEADTSDGKVSFEIALESKPSYISDFKLDKTVLTFDPEAFTGKIIASLDVAKEARSDGVDEIVLLLTAKDEATQPQEGKITIPLELLELSDLFFLARVHTENLNLRNILFTSEGVMPEVVPNLQTLVRATKDDDVTDPHKTVMTITSAATRFRDPAAFAAVFQAALEDSPFLDEVPIPKSIDEMVRDHIEQGTPLGMAAQRLALLQESGIKTLYVAGTIPEGVISDESISEGAMTPRFSILRPPPPPQLDQEGKPKLDDEGNPLPEEGREAKWEAFQSISELAGMITHEVDGWMVATPRPPTDPRTGAPLQPPAGADGESVLMSSLPTRLMNGILDESKAEGLPLLQALEDAPENDVSIAILMPTRLRELALAEFQKGKANFTPENRHLIPIVEKLLRFLDHKWIRVSITFGEDPDLELLAKFEDERIPGIIKEAYGAIIAEAVKALKVEPHKHPKIMQVRQHNRDINVGMIGRIKLLSEEGFLQLEEPEKLIKAILTDALGLQGEPYDDGSYDGDEGDVNDTDAE